MEPRVEPRVGGLRATVREGKKVNAVRVLHSLPPSRLGWRDWAPAPGGTGRGSGRRGFRDRQTLALDSSREFQNVGQLADRQTRAARPLALRRPVLPAPRAPHAGLSLGKSPRWPQHRFHRSQTECRGLL